MTEFDFKEVNPIDFIDVEGSDKYKVFEKKIMNALGEHITKNKVKKKYFALVTYEELTKSINIGKDLEKLGERIGDLLKMANKAKKASEEFHSKLIQISRESIPFAGDPFDKILQKECVADTAVKIFNSFIQEINHIKETASTSKKGKILKTGPNNLVALVVSNFLASTYHGIFGKAPGVGRSEKHPHKDEELVTCVFDRVCEVVEDTFSIEIPISTIRIAKETYPRWYKNEENN